MYDFNAILPELTLVVGGCLLVLADAFLPRWRPSFGVIAALIAAMGLAERIVTPLDGPTWSHALVVDGVSRYADVYVLAVIALVAILAEPYLARTGARYGEFHALLLWAGAGAMVMAKADHLLVIFVGLELLSISLYVLNAFHRDNSVSLEAGWKYLVVGAFAAGILLFGFALLYGATGTMSLAALATMAAQGAIASPVLALAGVGFILAGLAFKLALVPFHAWAPDVYQGSPTPVTAFLSVVPKGVVLVVLLRVAGALGPFLAPSHWTAVLAAIAVASMTLGNLVAIAQRDIKRMLAYSGIAHMGYALVGLVAYSTEGTTGVLVYFAAYALMNVAAFGVVAAFSESEVEPHLLTDLSGQGWRRPVLAFVLSVAMFSLAGIPPTVGFFGKFLVFRAAVDNGFTWLAVVGVLNSLVSVFYYLRVVFYLYMKPLPRREPAFSQPFSIRLVAVACATAIVVAGVLPGWILTAAEAAARTIAR